MNVLSVLIPIAALITGVNFSSAAVAVLMLCIEIIFCICLIIENRKSGNT